MLNRREEVESSVKEINEKCKEMFEDAESYGTINLHNQMLLVKEALDELNKEFEANGPGTTQLKVLKETAERRAVTLEYYLQAVCEKYRDLYNTRVFVDEFIKKVEGEIARITQLHNDDADKTDKVLWASYGSFALRIKRQSLHIIFNLSSEDRAMIDEITKNFQ